MPELPPIASHGASHGSQPRRARSDTDLTNGSKGKPSKGSAAAAQWAWCGVSGRPAPRAWVPVRSERTARPSVARSAIVTIAVFYRYSYYCQVLDNSLSCV